MVLLIRFAVFADKSLNSWYFAMTPSAVVAILSHFGQTAILAPVSACFYQSIWLSLYLKSRSRQPSIQVGYCPKLFSCKSMIMAAECGLVVNAYCSKILARMKLLSNLLMRRLTDLKVLV